MKVTIDKENRSVFVENLTEKQFNKLLPIVCEITNKPLSDKEIEEDDDDEFQDGEDDSL